MWGYASRRWRRRSGYSCARRHGHDYAEGQHRKLEQCGDHRANVMLVENRAGGIRLRRLIVMVRRSRGRHLRGMIVAMASIGVRMHLAGRYAGRNHRHQQQQAGQQPDGALDPEAHAALEDSK